MCHGPMIIKGLYKYYQWQYKRHEQNAARGFKKYLVLTQCFTIQKVPGKAMQIPVIIFQSITSSGFPMAKPLTKRIPRVTLSCMQDPRAPWIDLSAISET